MNSVACLVTSLQIQNSNNADVLLDSGLNLFDIMVNLCSKLYYEVLLKSWNYIVYLLEWTSVLDFNKGCCVIQLFEWTKALCNIANPCSELLCTEVKKCIEYLGIRLIVFRT